MDVDLVSALTDVRRSAATVVIAGVLRAVVRTSVADHLRDELRAIDDVASSAGVHADALGRVLRLLETEGWCAIDGDRVAATAKTALLRRGSPLWPSLAHVGTVDALHRLDHTLRTGESAFEAVFGAPFWSYLDQHPDEGALFAESMRNEGTFLNLVAVSILELGDAKTVADVGGGTGDLLAAILRANPHTHGVLLDQATVIERALPELRGGDLASRTTLVAGDLFGAIPTADVYVLARILHDWDDDDAARILGGVRAAAGAGSTLYDLDLVIPPGSDAHFAKTSDIGMMTTFGGGRERTSAEFEELFARTGWRLDEVTELPMTSVLRAVAV